MAIQTQKANNYTLGAGKVYFEQWVDENPNNTKGYRYLGSTSEFSLTSESEMLDHMSSEGGMRFVDAQVQTSSSLTGSLTTDNISPANLALYFSGEESIETAVAQQNLTQTVKAYPGMHYFIGASANSPQGEAAVENVTVTLAASPNTPLVEGTDYILDGVAVLIDNSGTSLVTAAGVDIIIKYDRPATTRPVVISSGKSIVGALRFVSNNATGDNFDYVLPKVRLTSNGDYTIKGGDDWLAMSMSLSVMKEGDKPMLYINGRPEI